VSLLWWFWLVFAAVVFGLLALDLGVFHRHAQVVTVKDATIWTAVRVIIALLFGAGIYYWLGPTRGLEYFTGYLIEQALSLDNIFVFVLIFSYFRVPAEYQHRVLFWGVIGALVMRGVMIALGAALIARFHWVIYVFGAFLVVTGAKMAIQKEEGIEPDKNPVLRWARRIMPVTPDYEGEHFFVVKDGVRMLTPLFLVLVFVETTDLMFAVDSIPAIFAVTRDPFIVFTSNVMAILGLRTLYFLLAGIINLFRYLKVGLAVVLVFVGVKMLISEIYHIPIGLSLGVVAGIIGLSILLSLLIPAREPQGAGARD